MRFAYRLAATLGIVDVQAMLDQMTPEQLDGWMAYDTLEPIGLRGVCDQLAEALMIMSVHSGRDCNHSDFVPGLRDGD